MRSRTTAVAGLLAGVLVLAACGNEDTETTAGAGSAGPSASESADSGADYNDADVSFVSGMVPHHMQAVEMADIVLADQPSPEIAAIAEEIKVAQQPEIEELNAMLDRFGVESDSSGAHGGAHGGGDAPMHGGMMTEQEMAAFETATGAESERMFLTQMIAHHQGAIEAAEAELEDGVHQPALQLAESIRDSQAAEIARMEQLLTQP